MHAHLSAAPPAMKNYFIYLPNRKSHNPWECVATSVGCSKIAPYHDYPPLRHPVDHHFTWANGRVLQAYQIIYISEGRGVFESESTAKRSRVGAGNVLLLFPGIWHRYAPDEKTGWAEHWIECNGGCFDRAKEAGHIAPEHAVLRVVSFQICCSAMTGAMAWLNVYRPEAKPCYRPWAYTFYRSSWKQLGFAEARRCMGMTLSKARNG
jgi:AraC-like ligand binding domain